MQQRHLKFRLTIQYSFILEEVNISPIYNTNIPK